MISSQARQARQEVFLLTQRRNRDTEKIRYLVNPVILSKKLFVPFCVFRGKKAPRDGTDVVDAPRIPGRWKALPYFKPGRPTRAAIAQFRVSSEAVSVCGRGSLLLILIVICPTTHPHPQVGLAIRRDIHPGPNRVQLTRIHHGATKAWGLGELEWHVARNPCGEFVAVDDDGKCIGCSFNLHRQGRFNFFPRRLGIVKEKAPVCNSDGFRQKGEATAIALKNLIARDIVPMLGNSDGNTRQTEIRWLQAYKIQVDPVASLLCLRQEVELRSMRENGLKRKALSGIQQSGANIVNQDGHDVRGDSFGITDLGVNAQAPTSL